MPPNRRLFYYCTVPLVFVLWAILIYQPSFRGPFQFDDNLVIVENPPVKNPGNLRWLWMFDPSRFITHLSFALNYHYHGMGTFGYHLVNFVLHLMVGFCVFFFARFIVYRRVLHNRPEEEKNMFALMASGIFLIHPLQTQAVSYISQRSTLLAALFYLLTLIFYVTWRQTGNVRYYLPALVAAGIGIFTKPNFITLPLALILCEVFFFGFLESKNKKVWRFLFPFFLIASVIPVLLILWKYKTFDPNLFLNISRETENISRGTYLLTQFNVLLTYLLLIFVPVGQNLDYDYPLSGGFFEIPVFSSFLALVALFVCAVRLFNKDRLFSFAVFWFFLTLSLESSVFPIADVIFEHRMYLPMAGIACVLPVLFRNILPKKLFWTGLCAALMALSVLTYHRNILWGNRMALLKDIAKKSPGKARVHNNLAIAYELEGDIDNAEREYRTAIALKPRYAHPHNNLGNIYASRGKTEEALKYFDEAIAIDPKYPAPLYNKGNIYFNRGEFETAWEYYNKALRLNPCLAPALTGLSSVCLQKEDYIKAKFFLTEALRCDPEYSHAYYTLGDVYRAQGTYDLAVGAYKDALFTDPDLVSAINNIGNIRGIQGNYRAAIKAYEMAIARDPSFANAYFNLGRALTVMGQKTRAVQVFKRALKLSEEKNDEDMAVRVREKLWQLSN